jgi:hypothetical protein
MRSKYGPLKLGDTSHDGMVFWGYAKGKEMWVYKETFDAAITKKSLGIKSPKKKK